jgi:crossover junction endodeoxyribonuclease RuvC
VRVIGIDPGTLAAGFGVVEHRNGRLGCVAYGVVRPPRGAPYDKRLLRIHEGLAAALAEHRPDLAAVEEGFYGKNVRSAMRLGEGRAVALLAVAQAGLPLAVYAPSVVKKAVVGSGTAHKSQVQKMIQALLGLSETPAPDAADALAIALCHCHRTGLF